MKTQLKTKTSLGCAFLLSFLVAGVVYAEEEETVIQEEQEPLIKGKKLTKEQQEIEDNRLPIGCRETGFRFELQTLHLFPGISGEKLSMYLLHNQTGQPITLYQMRDDESSRSLFLNHSIGGREWGILSTGENKVKFVCTVADKKTPYGKVVDCAQSFRVCQYTNVRYGLNNRGNFWLYNSSSRNAAVNSIVHYGIIPGN